MYINIIFLILSSVKIIDDSAFEVCQLFSAIRIPPSVHKIGDCVFAECELLSLNEFTSSELVTGKQVLIRIKGEIVTILKNLFKRNNEFKQINLLSPITIFFYLFCFYGWTSLNTFKLLNSTTALHDSLFKNCISLVEITIRENVNYIGENVTFSTFF